MDAGSCNGCEVEIGSAFGPVYDAERYGARLVASPRHADVLLVTGPVTRNMAEPLREAYEAMPGAEGGCRGGGLRARTAACSPAAYGVAGAVSDVVPVDVEIAGLPAGAGGRSSRRCAGLTGR